ncbi:MAG: Gfo/Idh/MocA family oxidoreductase [Bacteroidales bacterium]
MKKLFIIFTQVVLFAFIAASCCNNTPKEPTSNIIAVATPERPAGQTDVLKLTCNPIPVVRVGFIGLGMRGPDAVKRFTFMKGVEIKALCDLRADRVDFCQNILKESGFPKATGYSGSEDAWKQVCERDDIDLIYIAADWKRHTPMMLYAMNHGKHVACEVPAAMNMEEIWSVINTAEKTRKHCMQLENCVYDFFELTTLNMAQQGVFGDILHVEGAYIHNLEEFWDEYYQDWRLIYNKENRGDVYPTHGMGPACQLLNIHRGDKMNYLVCMDTKPVSIPAFIKAKRGEEIKDFKNGDHTMTMIKTEQGKTIQIQHDVANIRPYSRMYQLTGTKGFANKYPISGYVLETSQLTSDVAPDHENLSTHSFVPENVKNALMEKYKHPIHKDLEEIAKKVGGHGGMDFVMDYRLVYCLQNGLPLDMDVYDLAEWCCLAPLTKISLEHDSAPVEIPDFTRGGWNKSNKLEFATVENK